MAVFAGYGGNIKVGTDAIGEIGEWTVDESTDIHDVSAFKDKWKKKKGGQSDWSGNCTGRLDPGDTGQAQLINGAEVALKFYVDDTHYYSGNAIVESISRRAVVAGVLEVTFNFAGNGELSYT